MSHIAEGDFVVDHDERLAEVNAHGPCKTQLDQTTRHDRVSPQLLEHEVKSDASRVRLAFHRPCVLTQGIKIDEVGVGQDGAVIHPGEGKLGECPICLKQSVQKHVISLAGCVARERYAA